jgi:CheY-like chemotaxis protein
MAKPVFTGEILLCEDNKMNQQVMSEHLARVGVTTVVAENGQEGVEMVQSRLRNGEAPFDLIFMDIYMPVMDGLEAAERITALGTQTPIVAMTANVMAHDRERYKLSGMQDCLGKPFTSRELWRCLLKYLTPVGWKTVDSAQQHAHADEKMQHKLMQNFVRDNQAKFDEILKAIDEDDIKLAHRLAHTLKGNAGLLDEARLQQAAEDVERLLEGETNRTTTRHMGALNAELRAVLETFALQLGKAAPPPQAATRPQAPDAEKTWELIKKLQPLLDSGNPECLKLIDELRAMPGSETLIRLMEDFDFEPAVATLAEVQKEWV